VAGNRELAASAPVHDADRGVPTSVAPGTVAGAATGAETGGGDVWGRQAMASATPARARRIFTATSG